MVGLRLSGSGPFGSSGSRSRSPLSLYSRPTRFHPVGLKSPGPNRISGDVAPSRNDQRRPSCGGASHAAKARAPAKAAPGAPPRTSLRHGLMHVASDKSADLSYLGRNRSEAQQRRPRLALRVYRTIFCTGHSAQAPRELGRLKERSVGGSAPQAVSAGAGAAAKRRRQSMVAPAWQAGAFQEAPCSPPPAPRGTAPERASGAVHEEGDPLLPRSYHHFT